MKSIGADIWLYSQCNAIQDNTQECSKRDWKQYDNSSFFVSHFKSIKQDEIKKESNFESIQVSLVVHFTSN